MQTYEIPPLPKKLNNNNSEEVSRSAFLKPIRNILVSMLGPYSKKDYRIHLHASGNEIHFIFDAHHLKLKIPYGSSNRIFECDLDNGLFHLNGDEKGQEAVSQLITALSKVSQELAKKENKIHFEGAKRE